LGPGDEELFFLKKPLEELDTATRKIDYACIFRPWPIFKNSPIDAERFVIDKTIFIELKYPAYR
jgi:hypothetical protein